MLFTPPLTYVALRPGGTLPTAFRFSIHSLAKPSRTEWSDVQYLQAITREVVVYRRSIALENGLILHHLAAVSYTLLY